jgi:hypothetical protein
MDPCKALFVANDAAEQAMWAGASWSYVGIQATLSKLHDTLVVVARLSTDALVLSAGETPCLALSLSSLCESCLWPDGLISFSFLQELMKISMEKS